MTESLAELEGVFAGLWDVVPQVLDVKEEAGVAVAVEVRVLEWVGVPLWVRV